MKDFEPVSVKPRTQSFTHLGESGEVSMVDVSQKEIVTREAVARGRISISQQNLQLIEGNQIAKGNVLATARIAGIQAAKQTSQLIPLCHQLLLSKVDIEFQLSLGGIDITCSVLTDHRTGAEMEALTGVTVAALTIYDMCKAVDKNMAIGDVRLVSKMKRPLL